MKTVSIIVPLYQAEKYIRICVESILQQTYREIEVLLIDDGSTDQSFSICQQLQKEDARVKLIHQENMGVSAARNTGIRNVSGEYIVFVDADDMIAPDMVEYMVGKAEQHHSEIVICGFDYVYQDRIEKQIPRVEEGLYHRQSIYTNFWEFYREGILHNIGTKLYAQRLISQNNIMFDEDRTVLEDIQFCLDAIKNTDNIYICQNNFYKYIMQANQRSIQKTYRSHFYSNLQDFFRYIDKLGVEKTKDFYLIYMDAILLTIKNELYRDKKDCGTIIKEFKNICVLDYVKEASSYITREDVRPAKYVFYKNIWGKRYGMLFLLAYIWCWGSR